MLRPRRPTAWTSRGRRRAVDLARLRRPGDDRLLRRRSPPSRPSTSPSSGGSAAGHETPTHFFVHANYDPRWRCVDQPEDLRLWTSLREYEPGPHHSGKVGRRRPHLPEGRRDPRPRPPPLHRHLLLRRRLADAPRPAHRPHLAGRQEGPAPRRSRVTYGCGFNRFRIRDSGFRETASSGIRNGGRAQLTFAPVRRVPNQPKASRTIAPMVARIQPPGA